jgi:hypothetical protein
MCDESIAVEQRCTERFRYGAAATLRKLDAEGTIPGVVVDVSAGGCLLKLDSPANIPVGTPVDIGVTSKAISFRALGTVRHVCPDEHLVGICFGSMNRRGQADLEDLLAELEALHHKHPKK